MKRKTMSVSVYIIIFICEEKKRKNIKNVLSSKLFHRKNAPRYFTYGSFCGKMEQKEVSA